MRALRLLVLFAAALPLAGCPSTRPLDRPVLERAAGPYRHPASGQRFPESVAGFWRLGFATRYDEEGRDVSVGYNLLRPEVAVVATVYVFPAPRHFSLGSPERVVAAMKETIARGAYEATRDAILRKHVGARVVSETEISEEKQGAVHRGRRAAFEYEDRFAKARREVASELHHFCFVENAWILEFRFSHPRGQDASGAIAEFLREFEWTVGEEQPPDSLPRPPQLP